MRNLFGVVVTFFILLPVATNALSAQNVETNIVKTTKVEKERMVLMPLRVEEEYQKLQGSMETALVEGLQQRYEVFSGEQVVQKAKEIFQKESHSTKKECDETRCMQNIAEAFNAGLIATSNVTKQDGGYFLALKIENIIDNKVEYSKSLTCENCSSFQLIEKLKELSGLPVAPPSATEPSVITASNDETAMWNGVRSTDIIEDYEAYIAQYPNGKFVVLAQSRIKKIQELNEDQAWQSAEKAGTESDYKSYLDKYSPKGRYVVLAQNRIKKIVEKAELQSWQSAERTGSVSGFETYLQQFPQGHHAKLAQDKIQQLQKEEDEAAMLYQLRLANSGNIDAMQKVADLYDQGKGVTQDSALAKEWRDKAEKTAREQNAIAKAANKAIRISKISYLEHTKDAFDSKTYFNNNPSSTITTVLSPVITVEALLSDASSAPSKTTDIKKIEGEALLRPSTWGKPDSMIAKASQQFKPGENHLAAQEFGTFADR